MEFFFANTETKNFGSKFNYSSNDTAEKIIVFFSFWKLWPLIVFFFMDIIEHTYQLHQMIDVYIFVYF